MAPFAAGAMLQRVAAIVAGLAGVQKVYIGVPEAIDSRVSAYVTLGDLTPNPQATQQAKRQPEIMVTFAYRVAGAEATAELTLCDLVDAFTSAIYADRFLKDADQNPTSQNAELDMTMNNQPTYMAVAGSEFRRYIVVVRGLQTKVTP